MNAAEHLLPPDGRPLTLRLRHRAQLRVLAGRVWVTRAGWPQDHWLGPGQWLDLLPREPGGRRPWRGVLLVLSADSARGEPARLVLEPLPRRTPMGEMRHPSDNQALPQASQAL